MFLGEVLPDFRFFPGGLWLLVLFFVFVGLWPFGNKFLLIKKKKIYTILVPIYVGFA